MSTATTSNKNPQLDSKSNTMPISAETKVNGDAHASSSHASPADERINHMELQPTLNIGTIGHVQHGKSTLTKALSGVVTGKHREEQAKNMTIKLGYANAKIWRCLNTQCPAPWCYNTTGSKPKRLPKCKRPNCGSDMKLVRHVSFVDSPGHHDLMATMLSGAAVMDGALLVVAANEPCPSPQTAEHLVAAEISGFAGNTVVVQNKLDLVDPKQAFVSKLQLDAFLRGTSAEGRPVVPTSAVMGVNMDVLAQYIVTHIQQPDRDLDSPPRLVIVRSFDVNAPGSSIDSLRGGVVGGSITRGTLRIGDKVEIRPGLVGRDGSVTPVVTTVVSMRSEKTDLPSAVPGGLIAVGTELDPVLSKSDRLVGNMLGAVGSLPPVFKDVQLTYRLLGRVVGDSKTDGGKVKIRKNDRLLFCLGSARVEGKVTGLKSSGSGASKRRLMSVRLDVPICAEQGGTAALFQNKSSYSKQWRLIGSGVMVSATPLPLRNAADHKGGDQGSTRVSVAIKDDDEEDSDTPEDAGSEEEEQPQAAEEQKEASAVPLQLSEDGYDPEDNECNMHEGALPEKGQIVMGKIDRLDPQIGAYVSVLEYGGVDGLLVVRDISRKRIRSLKKAVRLGNVYPLRVTNVDERMNRVGLSKRDVEAEDAVRAEKWFTHTKLFHSLMTRWSNSIRVPLTRLYDAVGWPLYRHYAELAVQDGVDEADLHDPSYHPVQAFQELAQTSVGPSGPDVELGDGVRFIRSMGLPAETYATLVKCVAHRLTLKPSKVQAVTQLLCVQEAGVRAIKVALSRAVEADAKAHSTGSAALDEDESPPQVTLTTPPFYEVSMTARDTQAALKRVRALCESIVDEMKAAGGEASISQQPELA